MSATIPYDQWQPLSVAAVTQLFADAPFTWGLAGGYAIEQFLGMSIRDHDDISYQCETVPIMNTQRDWVEWHRDYDDPGSLLSRRLELVQGHLRAELDHAPAGDIRLISLCAGQGRDVIGVLAGHPRRDDVRARLVELAGVEMLQADAGITNACAGAVPAQIVVVCGIFGNITVSDIQATVAALPSLCAPGALVLWTRHRGPPDLTPAIRSWFGEAGFREEAFDISHDGFMSVGAHRLTGEPAALVPGRRLFTFVARI